MGSEAAEGSPAEQLIELLLYAPIGLLYEYQEVLPKLVKRGKSQVQIARIMGQMAVSRSQSDPARAVGDLATLASTVVAKVVTELGSQIGLAPDKVPATAEGPADQDKASAQPDAAEGPVDAEPQPSKPLPIARYDELTAREILPLLEELTADQRERVGAHERANRNRKTVLAKLDRLAP